MSRRLTIDQHAAWLKTGREPGDDDDLDVPLIEHPPALRPKREIGRLLNLLDMLANEQSNREEPTR